MSEEKTLEQLKAEVYDLIVLRGQAQQRIEQLDQQIKQMSQKQAVAEAPS